MSGYRIHILMGLPGSGKTFFANNIKKSVDYYDLDKNHGHITTVYLRDLLDGSYMKEIIFDGLVLTAQSLKTIIDICLDWGEKKGVSIEFEVHYWKENREACLKNDELRVNDYFSRGKDSKITIKNAEFDSLETITDLLKSYPNIIKIDQKEVYIPDDLDLILPKYSPCQINGEWVIKSKEWSNGGSWCDCWGNSGTVKSESPKDFTEFDDLLEEICPEITFLQYKKILQKCVTIITYDERDYYGGSISNSYHKCVIEDLKKTLKEMGLLKHPI